MKLGNTSPAKRLAQARAAERDKSGFIRMGTATGKLSGYGDGFSPDAGLPTGLTILDMSTHLHVTGKTGGGKTFNVLLDHIYQWVEHNAGGVFALDGKGDMGDKLLAAFIAKHGLKHNVILVKPGIRLGLMEGLTPHEFIEAIFDVGGAKKEEAQQSDAERFFATQAYTFGLSLTIILDELVKAQANEPQRSYFWHISGVDRFKMAMNQANEASEEILAFVRKLPQWETSVELQDAVLFMEKDFWTLPFDTMRSVIAVFDNMIKPLMQHPKLRPWCDMETGVDITIPLRGGFVSASLPEVTYGVAGKQAQSLMNQRMFSKIRRRAGDYDWKAAGETPVLFVKDEAQELITKADRDFLPVSRSLGGYALYATQSFDAYEARMGDAATRAFLDNFRSQIVFRSSPKTMEWIAKEGGRGRYISWNAPTQAIGFLHTVQRIAGHRLYDDSRPDSHIARQQRRRGAGRVLIPSGAKVANSHLGADAIAINRTYHDTNDLPENAAKSLSFVASMSGEIKFRDLLTLEDMAEQLNSPQDAIGLFHRAGSQRADYIHFDILTPQQVAEREHKFHRSLIFNSLYSTFKRDVVGILGSELRPSKVSHLTYALIDLALTEADYEAWISGLDELPADEKVKQFSEMVEARAELIHVQYGSDIGADRKLQKDLYVAIRDMLIDRWEEENKLPAKAT